MCSQARSGKKKKKNWRPETTATMSVLRCCFSTFYQLFQVFTCCYDFCTTNGFSIKAPVFQILDLCKVPSNLNQMTRVEIFEMNE